MSRSTGEAEPKLDGIELPEDPEVFRQNTFTSISDSLDNIGIFSMSDSVAHPLMWAHYASSHKGLALALRFGTAEDSIGAAYPIRYQD